MTMTVSRATSLCLVALNFALFAPRLMADEFFVQPTGSDSNPGTLKKPFATLQRAQQAVRKIAGRKPVTVSVRSGTYYLSDTLVLTAQDSGTAKNPVVYRAYRDEKPVISGGSRLNLKWEPYQNGILKAAVPAGTTSDQLFVNGERQMMARYPNYNPNERIFNGWAPDAFSPERAARWADPKGGFIHAMHSHMWGDYHYEITGKKESGEVTYIGGWQNNRQMGMHRDYRFVENIFEELDAPGEWFLNSNTNTLYFYPPAGLDLSKATVESVRLRHLIELRGDKQNPVRFVSFRGLTFRHAARTFMDNKEPLLRSDWTTYRGGAIFFNGAEDCALEGCFLDQLGGNSVFVNNYNRRIVVRTCRIEGGGAGGVVFVGDPKAVRSPLFEYNQVQTLEKIDLTPGPKTDNYPADCIVDDCLITRTGSVEKQTAPVSIEMSQSVMIRHCSIYDVPRAGINIGSGAWGGHVIEGCDVFDTVKETGDHGSFNSWGRDRFWRPNTKETDEWVKQVPSLPLLDVTKPNILHDNRWRCDHGWDIDLDDGSSNYHIYNNLCLKGGLKNREGFNRVVENNIIVGQGYDPHVWYANSQDTFRHNIVSRAYGPALMHSPPWGKEIDSNLLQRVGTTTSIPATDLQKQSGRDEHSIVADVMFVDPGKGDFRVKEGSPALALGFKNFAMDKFGVQDPALKAIAKTPFTSGEQVADTGPKRDSTIYNFLGAKVRDVMGQGEMSALGTAGETGVLLLEVGPHLGVTDVRKNDVIVAINGRKTDGTADLKRILPGLKVGQDVQIQITRTQKQIPLTVHITGAMPLGATQ
ncbi:PDZ domain-containing protein [bacterium]|nr:MAG: PDZ domain-containing protein [bacterium]